MQLSLLQLIVLLVAGYKKNKNIIKMPPTVDYIYILKCFEKTGLGFVQKQPHNAGMAFQLLYFNLQPVYTKIHILSTVTKRHYIKRHQLFFLAQQTLGGVYLISTSVGIITHYEALQLGIGGFLLVLLT
jgi:ribosomal protein S8